MNESIKCKCTVFFEPRSTRPPTITPRVYVSSAEIIGGDVVIHLSDRPVSVPADLAYGAYKVLSCCSNLPFGSSIAIDVKPGCSILFAELTGPLTSLDRAPEVSGNG